MEDIKLIGYNFADGVHWHWNGKEIAVIDQTTGEIEWLVRKYTLPENVIEAVREKKPRKAAKWEITVKRRCISATQGMVGVFIDGKAVASFNDEQILGKDGKYHSQYTDDDLGKLVYSTFWHKQDAIYHISNAAKDAFYPNWKNGTDIPETAKNADMYVDTPVGILHAYPSADSDYPGIYIDLRRNGYRCEVPLVLLDFSHTEFPECRNKEIAEKGVLVCRCWKDVREDDYKEEDRTVFTGYEEFFASQNADETNNEE